MRTIFCYQDLKAIISKTKHFDPSLTFTYIIISYLNRNFAHFIYRCCSRMYFLLKRIFDVLARSYVHAWTVKLTQNCKTLRSFSQNRKILESGIDSF